MKIYKYILIAFHLFNIFQPAKAMLQYYSNNTGHPLTFGFHIFNIIVTVIIISAIFKEKINIIYIFITVIISRALYYPIGWMGETNVSALYINIIGHIIGLLVYFLLNFIYIQLLKKKISSAENISG